VAGERELEAAAQSEAADRRDQRLLHRVLLVVDFGQVRPEARAAELADIGAAGEELRRADDHHRLHGGVGIGFLQVLHHGGAQGVAEAVDGGVVEGDDANAVADGVVDDGLRRFAHSSGLQGKADSKTI
jgi:hypothetical protein